MQPSDEGSINVIGDTWSTYRWKLHGFGAVEMVGPTRLRDIGGSCWRRAGPKAEALAR